MEDIHTTLLTSLCIARCKWVWVDAAKTSVAFKSFGYRNQDLTHRNRAAIGARTVLISLSFQAVCLNPFDVNICDKQIVIFRNPAVFGKHLSALADHAVTGENQVGCTLVCSGARIEIGAHQRG